MHAGKVHFILHMQRLILALFFKFLLRLSGHLSIYTHDVMHRQPWMQLPKEIFFSQSTKHLYNSHKIDTWYTQCKKQLCLVTLFCFVFFRSNKSMPFNICFRYSLSFHSLQTVTTFYHVLHSCHQTSLDKLWSLSTFCTCDEYLKVVIFLLSIVLFGFSIQHFWKLYN